MMMMDEKRPLPEGWVWSALKDISEVILGQSPPSSTYNSEGVGLPFFQGKAEFGELYPTPIKWCSRPQKIAEAGDVLVSVRAPVGSTNINREKSCIGRGLAAIRPKSGITNLYILYYLRLSEQQLIDQATGTTFQAISGSVLRNHMIPLAPPAEQERIVAEIEKQFTRLDAAVSALRRVQGNLARYKAAVLKAACEGRLVPQDPNDEPANELLARISAERRRQWEASGKKGKYREPVGVDVEAAELPELPQGWVWTNLGELKEFSLYGPRYSSEDYSDEGVLVLRTSDISEGGKVDFQSAPRLDLSDEEYEKYCCKPGDLLITRTGSLGTLAVFNDTVRSIPGAYLIQYRLAAPEIVSWYVYYVLKSPTGQKHLKGKGVGVGRPNLNAPTIEAFPIPLSPIGEQHRIVAELERRLSIVDAFLDVVNLSLIRGERLRQGILQRAFSGRLVAQNANP